MESTQHLSPDQRASLILYGSIEPPSNSNVSAATTKSDEKLDLVLSLSCYDSSSSSSSSLSSSKKRKGAGSSTSSSLLSYYNSESASTHHHIPKKPFNNRYMVLLDSQETQTLTLAQLRLSLSPPDPFEIKKTLEESDVNNLARLMLAKGAVEAHVVAHWDEDMKERLKDKEGVAVKVWDMDRDVEHDMRMKIWGRNGSVVINNKWIGKFVRRRGLRKGDRIGLCWDRLDRRLVFSVLEQVPVDATPISFHPPNNHHQSS